MQVTLRYTAEGSHLSNDMLIQSGSRSPIDIKPYRTGASDELGFAMTICIDLAVGAGSLYLRDKDPHIQPFLDYNYLEDDFDTARLREGVRICLDFAEHESWDRLVKERVGPDGCGPGVGRGVECLDQTTGCDQPSCVGHLQNGTGFGPDGGG